MSATSPGGGDSAGAVNTLCAYCGVGCGMVLQVERPSDGGRATVRKSSGNKTHPANFGRLLNVVPSAGPT